MSFLKKIFIGSFTLFFFTLSIHAQSIDDLELRKRKKVSKIGLGFLGIFETATSLNADRPTLTNLLYLAPQLKLGDRIRLRVNTGFYRHWLDRQENHWDMTDLSLQLNHLGFYREPITKILFSGSLRYSFPTSKASRNASSYGQIRSTLKMSRTFLKRFFIALELGARKNFHPYTSWDLSVDPLYSDSISGAGFDEFVQNNISFGFSQTLTGGISVIPGLDFNLIFGLRQGLQYQAENKLTQEDLNRPWVHTYRLILDTTLNLAQLMGVKKERASIAHNLFNRSYISFGYALYKPQLVDGKRDLNPFDPRFSSLYLDLMVVY